MAIKKHIALYFSSEALSLAELNRHNLLNHYHIPYDILTTEERDTTAVLTEEIRLTAVLQKTLRDNKIVTPECFASLPVKDIILRSFFIPQMASQEIVGAVEFEARKYIPFKLDELVYDFQATKVKEPGAKKLRILFVGIKKDILAKYFYILEQTNLKIASLEPSPISLLRILTQKKLIASNRSCAVIEVEQEQGNIIILDKGLPQFIRDFKLMPAATNITESPGEDSSYVRLLNEVRVSLDYYRRQFPQGVFDKIIFCSERDVKGWAENLQKELNLPVAFLKPQDVLGLKEYVDIGLLKAVGAGIKDYVNMPITINLSQKRITSESKEAKPIKPFLEASLSITSIIRWALGVAAGVFLVYIFSMRPVWDLKTRINKVSQVNSKYSNKTSEELRNLAAELNKKILALTQISTRKYVTAMFAVFAKELPSGAWINNFDLRYNAVDKSINLTLKGSVYSEEVGSQIDSVNRFLENLKNDAQFSQNFKSIELNFVNQSNAGEFPVTNFEIVCR